MRDIFVRKGVPTTYHREGQLTPCPCLTPEGFRDPVWHKEHPSEPVCNSKGYLFDAIEFLVNAFIQPIYGSRRLTSLNQGLVESFGELQIDDQVGMFPTTWNNRALSFENWSDAGDEWIGYHGKYFTVIAYIEIPDPFHPANVHHIETSLRRIDPRLQ